MAEIEAPPKLFSFTRRHHERVVDSPPRGNTEVHAAESAEGATLMPEPAAARPHRRELTVSTSRRDNAATPLSLATA